MGALGSWEHAECVDRLGREWRWLEQRRHHARRSRALGHGRDPSWSSRTRGGREGFGTEAHSGSGSNNGEMLSRLGEALGGANRQ